MNINVLIVDDSRLMRTQMKSIMNALKICQCNFIEAENGEEAFTLLQVRHIELVLLDWNMPKMSGIDFLKQLRSMERFKDLPVLMVTSNLKKEQIIEALQSGATDYIAKPFNPKLFAEKIYKCLKAMGVTEKALIQE